MAITRAETHFIFPLAVFGIMERKPNLLYFMEEIRTGFDLPIEKPVLVWQALSDFQFLLLQGQQPPEMERIEMDFINRVLEKFQMNVTA